MTKETAICKIHKENNIIHIQFNEDVTLKQMNLNEIYEYISDVYGNNNLPKLIDLRASLSIDDKAKQVVKDQNSSVILAKQAVLTGKNTNEEILKVFIGIHGEKTPVRTFTNYENAITWLMSSEK